VDAGIFPIMSKSSHHQSANIGNGAVSVVHEEEHVIAVPDPNHPNWFVPKVTATKKSGLTVVRDFEALDMARVLDFDKGANTVASASVVRDEPVMIGDFEGDGTGDISFPVHHLVLRGGFIFCFNVEDVDEGTGQRYTTYENPPVCVISLENVDVQFPPGGRRVFREHAHTTAQSGYELVILHMPPENSNDEPRPPSFLVTDSLSKRNKWAEAIKVRSKLNQPTILRAGYTSATAAVAASDDPLSMENRAEIQRSKTKQQTQNGGVVGNDGTGDLKRKDEMLSMVQPEEKSKATKNVLSTTGRNRNREVKSMEKKIMEIADDADLAGAVVQFGAVDFDEQRWISEYWESHYSDDAAATCEQMEKWLLDMKKSLKGAVLEQYEYFVQASGEMTTMGREVTSLKMRIEQQGDLLKNMKEIDFLGALRVDEIADKDEIMGRDDDGSDALAGADAKAGKSGSTKENDPFYADDLGEMMNKHRGVQQAPIASSNGNGKDASNDESTPSIEFPDWLEDVDDEIAATICECRYNTAIELYLKATNEISDLLDKHERPTAYRLTRAQLDSLRSLKKSLKTLSNRMCIRLEESLRRKNEALRQATKRERSEASAAIVPLVSPCALSDDTLYLQLLVKLGRTQEAADSFSARRSLLLLETLQERPISGAGTVDLVIYAAQLSQSFFSCLASSVEGFLDLFLMSGAPPAVNGEKSSEDSDSLHSNSLGAATKNLPPGAVSALVLWCDSELVKFAMAFGGTRVLSNLALSPPKSTDVPTGPRVVGSNDNSDSLKERRNAIEVAAQCIDQAFLYASQNLDSVGLPLTPRLAEMVRVRLKGCEHEVSLLLDERWQSLTQDWRINNASFDSIRY
jgi:hypothetical protein